MNITFDKSRDSAGKSPWKIEFTNLGKRKRRFFRSKKDAADFISRSNAAKKYASSAVLHNEYSVDQLADISEAMRILPRGANLVECVSAYIRRPLASKPLSECMDVFMETKAAVRPHTAAVNKSRLTRLLEIGDFSGINASSILSWVGNLGLQPKTRRDYLVLFKEFFDYCETRGFININPFHKIHKSDFPKIIRPNPPIAPLESVRSFFADMEESFPEYVSVFALVAFGGLRRSEAEKLPPSMMDFKNRRITIPKTISKTPVNWIQEKLPETLWPWLEKYPPKVSKKRHFEKMYGELRKRHKLPENGLRHAFATYHLSLHRDQIFTSDLMRHSNPKQLWKTYLGDLVSKETAHKYFNIVPVLS